MSAVAREERFVERDGHGGNPQVVLSDALISRFALELGANSGVNRNHRAGVGDRNAYGKKLTHRFCIVSGENRSVPKFPKNNPWNSKGLEGIRCGMGCRPSLASPKTSQIGGVGNQINGSCFAVQRFSMASSNTALVGRERV